MRIFQPQIFMSGWPAAGVVNHHPLAKKSYFMAAGGHIWRETKAGLFNILGLYAFLLTETSVAGQRKIAELRACPQIHISGRR
jgi:hypothetical protein